MELFAWLESTGFSTWIRESDCVCAYDSILASHAIGMAAVVGLSVAVALRILGFAPRVPLAPLEGFFPFMYAGFWLNAVSGLLLLLAYPTRAFTNPGFYIKIGSIALAVVCLRRIRNVVFGNPANLGTAPVPLNGRVTAGALLFSWWGAIVSGRLLAYHDIANVERESSFAIITATLVLLAAVYGVVRVWAGASGHLANARRGETAA